MKLSSNVNLHVIVPDTDPFILFGIEILTDFSRSIITKRFTDISRFHNNLCYFAHTSYSPGKILMDVLPTLPYPQLSLITLSSHAITERKSKVEKYFKSLCTLYNQQAKNQKLPWVRMIRQFINLDLIEQKQQKAAALIQRSFKKYMRSKNLKRKAHEYYVARGYTGLLEELPDSLLIYICSFLHLKDLFRTAQVNKRWNQITEQPILWTTLNLFQSKMKIESLRFQGICRKAWQLKQIDLRYCQFITSESLQSISQNCNPEA